MENFNSIELTEKELSDCFRPAIEQRKYEFYKINYADLIIEGKTVVEADKLAKEAEKELEIELTEEEKQICILSAKEAKFYQAKANTYFESLKLPKRYELPSKWQFYKDVDARMLELTESDEFKTNYQYELLQWYFSKDSRFVDSGYSLSKGLLLVGPVGCGKTTMMKAFSKNIYQSFTIISCRKIADEYKNSKPIYRYSDVSKNNFPHLYYGHSELGWCFDDLGTEEKKKNFGDELNVMEDIILNWYDKLTIGFNKIHITTNLYMDQIEEKYTARVRSRMRQMFNVIEFNEHSKDLRK